MLDYLFETISNIDFTTIAFLMGYIFADLNDEFDENDEKEESKDHNDQLGCIHYKRGCKIVSPCCNIIYPCRLCHDQVCDHKIDRYKINMIICSSCNKLQSCSQYCDNCHICFGKYYCDICKFFDNTVKGQYHCTECGMCRKINVIDDTIHNTHHHCDDCQICIQNNSVHKCLPIKGSVCSVCRDDLFTSMIVVLQTKCGHYIHQVCLNELLQTSYKCPVCSKSLVDDEVINKLYDDQINDNIVPDEHKNITVDILCNECQNKSVVKYNKIGHKCLICNSYNTRRT